MYLEHFKLKELPFRLSADARFHFLGVMQDLVKSELRQSLEDGAGCMLLTGEAGVGKSILLEDLLPVLPDHYRVIHIKLPELTAVEFYRAALEQLGESPQAEERGRLMAEFEGCLERLAAARLVVAAVIDSAESAGIDLLQELLRLSRRSAGSVGNLRIVHVGRPSLEQSVAQAAAPRPANLTLKLRLKPLEPKDTRRYVRHRIEIAGGNADALFEEDCYVELQRYAGGVPRLINTLADAALVTAYNRNRSRVSAGDVRGAVDQLQWVEFSARQPVVAAPVHDATSPPVVREPMVGRVRIERQGCVLAEFELPVGKVSIGRARNNDVRIDSQFISRHHCHLVTTPQYSVIEDLQSQNGIVIDGRRVSVHRLRDGDEVSMGDHKLVFERVEGVPAGDAARLFPMTLSPEGASTDEAGTRVLSFHGRLIRPVLD